MLSIAGERQPLAPRGVRGGALRNGVAKRRPRKKAAPLPEVASVTIHRGLGELLKCVGFSGRSLPSSVDAGASSPPPHLKSASSSNGSSSSDSSSSSSSEAAAAPLLCVQGRAVDLRPDDADDLVAVARMLEEEDGALCQELGIDGGQIDAQEAAIVTTTQRRRVSFFDEPAVDRADGGAKAEEEAEERALVRATVRSKALGTFVPAAENVDRLRAADTFYLRCSTSPTASSAATADVPLTDDVVGVVESGRLVSDLDRAATARLLDINSGGEVYFVFLRAKGEQMERALVLKFGPNRMATQGEALAYELAEALGAPSPRARLLRTGAADWDAISRGVRALQDRERQPVPLLDDENRLPGRESSQVSLAAAAAESKESEADGSDGGDEGAEEEDSSCADALARSLGKSKCVLAVELVQGSSLAQAPSAFSNAASASSTASALGRLFALDLALGNPDRLPNRALGWRGNPNNIRWDIVGRRVRGIDHTLARRPPRGLQCTPETAAEATLALLGGGGERQTEDAARGRSRGRAWTREGIVREALESFLPMDPEGEAKGEGPDAVVVDAVDVAFCEGFRSAMMQAAPLLKSIDALCASLDEALEGFFSGLRKDGGHIEDDTGKSEAKQSAMASTKVLRQIQNKARKDRELRDSFVAAERGLVDFLRSSSPVSSEEQPHCGSLSFLASPDMASVNAYELRSRLRHISSRLRSMADNAPPCD